MATDTFLSTGEAAKKGVQSAKDSVTNKTSALYQNASESEALKKVSTGVTQAKQTVSTAGSNAFSKLDETTGGQLGQVTGKATGMLTAGWGAIASYTTQMYEESWVAQEFDLDV